MTFNLANTVKDTAVATRGDLPLELEFEVLVLANRDQVTAGQVRPFGVLIDIQVNGSFLDDPLSARL